MTINLYEIKKAISELEATNNNDLYKSHLYWSQKPFNICNYLIENFSKEGDVIFDPFMGSGVTVIQALDKKFARKAVGVEINDVPIFIVNTLLNQYDIKYIEEKVNLFIDKVLLLNKYYSTFCPICGGEGTVKKVLFDREDWKSSLCLKNIYYKCKCSKQLLSKSPDIIDIEKININHGNKCIKDSKLIYNSRLAVGEGQRISSIFTKRNLAVLDEIIQLTESEDVVLNNCLRYIVLSVIHLSKITDTHSNSQWPLWTPKKDCVEKNVVDLIVKRANLFLKSLKYAEKSLSQNRERCNSFNELSDGKYLILQKGIQNISEEDIPNESVDLIITDPPYLGQILYSEYMQLYKPFLNFNFNLEEEIVVSSAPDRNKKEDDYYDLLEQAIKVMSLKIKENKYMCMYFHDSNLDVWNRLISILSEAGFRYLSQVHVKKKNTLKNIISPKKSLNGDAILFFLKDSVQEKHLLDVESIEEIEQNIIKHAKYIIRKKGPLTTPELYDDGMMEFIIHNGWLNKLSIRYKSLVDIFEKYLIWDNEIGKWKI